MPVELKPKPMTKPEESEPERLDLTTIEEQREYDNMLEKDFIKINPITRNPASVERDYQVVHTFPEYQSSNPTQFRARFVVTEWEYAMNPDGTKRRQNIGQFTIVASEFKKNYLPTITETLAKAEGQ